MTAHLPPLLVLTDRRRAGAGLVATVTAAVEGGARAVVLREKDLAGDARLDLALALSEVLGAVGGALVLAGPDVDLARHVGAVGLHLAASDALPATSGGGLLVGRSCHSDEDVRRAAAEGADYVSVSPVFPSPSKPGYGPPLGVGGLARAVLSSEVPVFALGGITAATAPECLAAGVAGVAVMGAVMAAADPAAAAAALANAVQGQVRAS